MYVYLKDQFLFLTASFVVGIFLGSVYDIFRIFRIMRGHKYSDCFSPLKKLDRLSVLYKYNNFRKSFQKNIFIKRIDLFFVFIEDILYSIILIVTLLILIYGGNYGIARSFSFCAIIVGFVLYRFTIGRVFILVFEYLLYFFGAILFLVFYPIAFFIKKTSKMIYKSILLIYNRNVEKKLLNYDRSCETVIIHCLKNIGKEV